MKIIPRDPAGTSRFIQISVGPSGLFALDNEGVVWKYTRVDYFQALQDDKKRDVKKGELFPIAVDDDYDSKYACWVRCFSDRAS